jgi:hypothetical protein
MRIFYFYLKFFFPLQRPDLLFVLPSLLFSRHWDLFPGNRSDRANQLFTHNHVVPRLRISGVIPPLMNMLSWNTYGPLPSRLSYSIYLQKMSLPVYCVSSTSCSRYFMSVCYNNGDYQKIPKIRTNCDSGFDTASSFFLFWSIKQLREDLVTSGSSCRLSVGTPTVLNFLTVNLVCEGKFENVSVNYATTASFHILPHSLFTIIRSVDKPVMRYRQCHWMHYR